MPAVDKIVVADDDETDDAGKKEWEREKNQKRQNEMMMGMEMKVMKRSQMMMSVVGVLSCYSVPRKQQWERKRTMTGMLKQTRRPEQPQMRKRRKRRKMKSRKRRKEKKNPLVHPPH